MTTHLSREISKVYSYSMVFTAMAVVLGGILLSNDIANAQDQLNVIRGESSNNSWLQFSDAPNALYHHLADEAYELLDRRVDTVAGLRTLSDWQERQQHVRDVLMDMVGPFPEKTPLNATVTRTVEKADYRVEHIVYESQPGFYVTSSLYIPHERQEEPSPAVIYVSGHTNEGYRSEVYQHKILNLVNKGFIVFAFDPVGQGERLEYYDPETDESTVGGPTSEHSTPGAQAFITGSAQARYMIWDGIRAVDYLLSRDEVDPDRIGITGRSGGGTQSSYIAAFDDRIHAAAPEAYITSFTRLLQSIGPQDAEQLFPGGIARGIDHADLLAVRAPRPALMITTTEDYFSIQGARETAREVAGLYNTYGRSDNFSMVEDGGPHGSTEKNREAMYAFFQEHLNNPGSPDDQEVEPLTEEEMRVTETGQLSTSLEGETVFSLNRRDALQRIDSLQASRENLSSHLPRVLESARQLSGYREPDKAGTPVFTGRIQRDGYNIEKYFIQGEGDYPVPYLLMVPEDPNGNSILYLHPSGKADEAGEGGQIEWFVRHGFTVLVPDLIGTGETSPEGSGDLRREWRASVLTGRSLVGIRAGDIVRLARLLEEEYESEEIYGVALENTTPALLHAAAFDSTISRVVLLEPYVSYRSIAMNREYEPVYIHSTVSGALQGYDIPDLAASLAPRKLLMSGLRDGKGRTANPDDQQEDLSVIKRAYANEDAADQLDILFPQAGPPAGIFQEWIE